MGEGQGDLNEWRGRWAEAWAVELDVLEPSEVVCVTRKGTGNPSPGACRKLRGKG